ncbi:hypothetical protein KC640_00115 [Candidatus Dojkabacteria bacterium]|uniref:Uncharacterized protein n=1 Tax=Candidatus Dojkabacteria bacterium TaxID=2099670 RepID=A0A955I4M3_9BACT|nr:hypothetical protein [Candidatus Dojkabacteria bacterium]
MARRKRKVNNFHLAIVGMLILLTGLLLIKVITDVGYQIKESAIIPQQTDLSLDTLPVEDPTRVNLQGPEVKVPADWTVSALLESTKGTGYECNLAGCTRVAIVGSKVADSVISRVIISSPGFVVFPAEVSTTSSEIVLDMAGEQVTFTALRYYLADFVQLGSNAGDSQEEEFTDYALFYELMGCSAQKVCVQVGPLAADVQQNQAQVKAFQAFLSELTIE